MSFRQKALQYVIVEQENVVEQKKWGAGRITYNIAR